MQTSKASPPERMGEVVIFHGVRIERLTDEMIEQAKRNRRLPALNNHAIAEELE
jgi:hypothetical protein